MIGTDIKIAQLNLENNKLVAIPTETVYGLAANGLNENAVLKIFEAKQRPFFDPLILHVNNIDKVKQLTTSFDPRLKSLAQNFWPGPLTLLLPKSNVVPDIVTSGLNNVAVRIPNHPLTLKLLSELNFPLAAPSANPFGYISPTCAAHVQKQLGNKVDYILDGGTCEVGLESSIVGIEDDKVCVYRLGGLSIEQIESVIGKVEIKINTSSNPKVPGQLKSHYAPKKPLFIGDFEKLINENKNKKIICICFGNKTPLNNAIKVLNLSKEENLTEAAKNLFKLLREADEMEGDVIITNFVTNTGLGLAINDRLTRAAAK